jgi:nitrogen fixation NifU-like protein
VYSPQLLDHFEHPRNAGVVEPSDATAQQENPVCADVLKLSARIHDGRISEIKFQAKGCVPAVACGSAITLLAAGCTLAEAAQIKNEDVVRTLGELPPASGHAADLAVATLSAVLQQLSSHGAR